MDTKQIREFLTHLAVERDVAASTQNQALNALVFLYKLEKVRAFHENDCERGFGHVNLPGALVRKYPNASRQLAWQYVFPSKSLCRDPRSGEIRRHTPPLEGVKIITSPKDMPGIDETHQVFFHMRLFHQKMLGKRLLRSAENDPRFENLRHRSRRT